MNFINELLINKNTSITDAIKRLDDTARRILFVVENKRLIGTITDGDIRRWILKNGSLDDDVSNIMKRNYIYISSSQKYKALEILEQHSIVAVPILNKNGEILEVIFQETKKNLNITLNKLDNKVVVMAGGKGTRLYPYTQILPKPLIPIVDKSIIEHIFNNFYYYGCTEFILTLNYKKGMIKSYLDELDVPYKISYVEEEDFFGTAGSLEMLKGKMDKTFFVTNCDVLISANYEEILKQHINNKNKITLVTSLTNFTIPYGVVKTKEEGQVVQLEEKPEYNFQINTGIYVLEPEVLEDIPEKTFFHITDLINMYLEQNKKVGIFPIRAGQWQDMGEINLMNKMIEEYSKEREDSECI